MRYVFVMEFYRCFQFFVIVEIGGFAISLSILGREFFLRLKGECIYATHHK